MTLFERIEAAHRDDAQPLAARMRPRTLAEFVGQRHLLEPGKLLHRLVAAKRVGSVILFGPPGTGKTTLAQLIAKETGHTFQTLNAAAAGVKELRDALDAARSRLETTGKKSVLFVDELHHFNKQQQNVLLPDVEQGIVSLIAATTANPFFSLIAPLLSRSQILELFPLTSEDILDLLRRALADTERGLGDRRVTADDDALEFLAASSDGDARRALGGLELAVLSLPPDQKRLDLATCEDSIQRKAIRYDGTGDDHYDVISAFIKSMRGSDPDAAVYWLARMLESGEDPRFVARRIVICASEDVGNADPQALVVAMSAAKAVEFIGMPEGRIPLAQAAIYVAMAPKSNASYNAINAALDDIRQQRILPVPTHLQGTGYAGAKRLGHGVGYVYPHDEPGGWTPQAYLTEPRTYFEPTDRGHEASWREPLDEHRAAVRATFPPGTADGTNGRA